MILDELKAEIEALSPMERRELSVFLLKLELCNDQEYLDTIRERRDETAPETWIPASQI